MTVEGQSVQTKAYGCLKPRRGKAASVDWRVGSGNCEKGGEANFDFPMFIILNLATLHSHLCRQQKFNRCYISVVVLVVFACPGEFWEIFKSKCMFK